MVEDTTNLRTIDYSYEYVFLSNFLKRIRNINMGLDVNKNTLLHKAVASNNFRAMHALLHLGADPNCKNSDGKSAFELAFSNVTFSNLERLKILIYSPLRPNILSTDSFRSTLTLFSSYDGQITETIKDNIAKRKLFFFALEITTSLLVAQLLLAHTLVNFIYDINNDVTNFANHIPSFIRNWITLGIMSITVMALYKDKNYTDDQIKSCIDSNIDSPIEPELLSTKITNFHIEDMYEGINELFQVSTQFFMRTIFCIFLSNISLFNFER